jgi:hypothetical protein
MNSTEQVVKRDDVRIAVAVGVSLDSERRDKHGADGLARSGHRLEGREPTTRLFVASQCNFDSLRNERTNCFCEVLHQIFEIPTARRKLRCGISHFNCDSALESAKHTPDAIFRHSTSRAEPAEGSKGRLLRLDVELVAELDGFPTEFRRTSGSRRQSREAPPRENSPSSSCPPRPDFIRQ